MSLTRQVVHTSPPMHRLHPVTVFEHSWVEVRTGKWKDWIMHTFTTTVFLLVSQVLRYRFKELRAGSGRPYNGVSGISVARIISSSGNPWLIILRRVIHVTLLVRLVIRFFQHAASYCRSMEMQLRDSGLRVTL